MDERDAIARLKDGDIGGLETLVRRHQWEAVRVASLITRDRQLAEEVVQEAFVRVFERIAQFDSSRPFAPWFYRIVANDAVKAAQRRTRQRSFTSGANAVPGLVIDDAPGPEEVAEAIERSESIQIALGQLPPAQRAVIVMRYYLDMTDAETAARLGSNRGTIKWRLHAARQRLRSLLHPYEPQPLNPTSTRSPEEKDQ